MAEYALVGPADEIKTIARDVKPDVGTKPGWRWLPVERSEDSYDPAIEILEPESMQVVKDRVVVSRTARPKTDEELDQEKSARIDDALPPALLSVLTGIENRLRALEGKPARSEDEFRLAARQLVG
jgi:hypothetical protein